jgi:hypothetical protein
VGLPRGVVVVASLPPRGSEKLETANGGTGLSVTPLRFWSGDRIRTGDVQRGETNAPVTVCDTQTPITMHQGSRAAALFGHPP